MDKKELKKIGLGVINQVPSMEEAYVTADGQCFNNAHSATNHQKELLGKYDGLSEAEQPVKVTREVAEAKAKAKTANAKTAKGEPAAASEESTEETVEESTETTEKDAQ